MPSYAYTACDTQQQTIRGHLEATSRQAAARQLTARGLRPTQLREAVETTANKSEPLANTQRIKAAGSSFRFTARERLRDDAAARDGRGGEG